MKTIAESFNRLTIRQVGYRYLLHLPKGYKSKGARHWPLVVFLHGIGERGNNLNKVKLHGLPRRIKEGANFPFIVVAPQCPLDSWWDGQSLSALVDHVVEKHRVDANRIYVTGLSMGGRGTWDCAHEFGYRLAAIAPICPPGRWWFRPGSIETLPIWCFHGGMDDSVPIEESLKTIRRIRAMGGNVRFTVYPDAGHDTWTETYRNPELYKWLLKHTLRNRKQAKPRRKSR